MITRARVSGLISCTDNRVRRHCQNTVTEWHFVPLLLQAAVWHIHKLSNDQGHRLSAANFAKFRNAICEIP